MVGIAIDVAAAKLVYELVRAESFFGLTDYKIGPLGFHCRWLVSEFQIMTLKLHSHHSDFSMKWVNFSERMANGKSHSGFAFAKILRARSLNADTERKRFRGGGSGYCRGVWGERVVVGQDGEDASARWASQFNASKDASGDARRRCCGGSDAGGGRG
jgi:hypothetical protein